MSHNTAYMFIVCSNRFYINIDIDIMGKVSPLRINTLPTNLVGLPLSTYTSIAAT